MLLACASQAWSGRLLLGHFCSNDAVPHTGMHRLASNPGCLWRSCQQCAPHVTPYYSTGPSLRRCHKGHHCHDCHCCTSMKVPIKVNELAHHRANVCAAVGTTQSHNGKVVSGLFAHEFICHMLAHLVIVVHGQIWRQSAGQNAFFATTALLGALLADKRTKQGVDFTSTVGWFALTFPLFLRESFFILLFLGCCP